MDLWSFLDRYKYSISIVLLIIIFWRFIANSIILILIIISCCCLFSFYYNQYEYFDDTLFLPPGYPKYDLRGYRLHTRPIFDCRYNCYNNCYNSNF